MFTLLNWLYLISLSSILTDKSFSQLKVNIKNEGGDTIRESIVANTSQDVISLSFQQMDGTLVTQFLDMKNDLQIFRIVILGEEELGYSEPQTLCFIHRIVRSDFIATDAMSKLRQKNPNAIRSAEENLGVEVVGEDLQMDIDQSYYLSPHIMQLCRNAADSTYTRVSDIKILAKDFDKDPSLVLSPHKRLPFEQIRFCNSIKESWKPCLCSYILCIGWYPCGLKYCRGKDSLGKLVSYRCGIKTCQKCRNFEYYVYQKQICRWEDYHVSARLPEIEGLAIK